MATATKKATKSATQKTPKSKVQHTVAGQIKTTAELKAEAALAPGLTPEQVDVQRLLNRGVMVLVSFGTPGFTRKVSKDAISTTDAAVDKKVLRVAKEIIDDCDEYNEIGRYNGQIKKFLQLVALPTGVGGIESVYMIPAERFGETMKTLTEMREKRREIIEEFLKVYDKAKLKSKDALGPLYNEDDFPSKEELRYGFYMRIVPFQLNVPGVLKTIDEQLQTHYFEQEQSRLTRQYQDAAVEMRLMLRETMRKLVAHLLDKLTGEKDGGGPKILRESAVTHINDFIQYFNPKNITDDAELKVLVDKTRDVMKGVDIEQLRDDQKYRAEMGRQMAAISTALDGLMVAQPARAIKVGGGKKK